MTRLNLIVLTFLISLFSDAPSHAKNDGLKVEITHSEAASYMHFLDSGFDQPFTSGSLKSLIELKKIKAFKDKKLKDEYLKFKSYVQKGYNFDDEQPNRPEGFWAEDALQILAVNSSGLADFERNLSAFVSYRGIGSYHKVKERLYPLFLKYHWRPTLKSQDKEIAETKKILESSNFTDLLEKARAFYRSDYPQSLSFKVGLTPIPDTDLKKRHTSASNLRDVQLVPYHSTKGVKDNLDVIFHEFCHALYEGQSSKVKKQIDQFYLNSSDPHSIFVYRYLNEVLATAWGNGWYHEVLFGKHEEKSWYSVDYIDRLAKAFLPLLKEYVQKEKNLDKQFMAKSIEIAKKVFPNAPRELATNMLAVKILADHEGLSGPEIRRALQKQFRIQSVHSSSPALLEDLAVIGKQDYKTVFLVSKDPDIFLGHANKHLKASDLENELKNKKDFLAIIPNGPVYVFWINAANLAKVKKLIGQLAELKLLPVTTTVMEL